MTKYIEVEVPDCDYAEGMSVSYMMRNGHCTESEPQRISRGQLLDLVNEFCRDIEAAFGMGGLWKDDIDEPQTDWPDLADTYRKARLLLTEPEDVDDTGLTAEQLENKYAPDGGELDDCHPEHTARKWQARVTQGSTRLGYWDWVVQQIEEADHD